MFGNLRGVNVIFPSNNCYCGALEIDSHSQQDFYSHEGILPLNNKKSHALKRGT